MDNLEERFSNLEIDEELQQLKQKRSPNLSYEKILCFYQLLNLPSTASREEVKQAYKTFVKKYHPDRFYNNPQRQQLAQEIVQKINSIYEQLFK